MSKRRVVITGIGMITPLGISVPKNWENILNAKSGIKNISHFDTSPFSSKIAGLIDKTGPEPFIAENYIEPKEVKKMDLFIQYGMAAATEAILDSGWKAETEYDQLRTGVIMGSGIGGLYGIEQNANILYNGGRVSPFFIASSLINLLSGNVSIKHGFRGPNHSIVTACATGTHTIGDAARIIKYGDADVMIAGGAEAAVTPLGVGGFAAARALSSNFNDKPEKASRPWDKARDGFVISEGAGVLVLEEYEHAKKRDAKIYGEVVGYGMAGDAYHITSPHPEGLGAKNAMKAAISDAGINISDIDYINAHGTSTPIGDQIELDAVQSLFCDANSKIVMSSTKSMIGHLLGAAGAVEAIYTLLSLRDQIAPPTINLDDPVDNLLIDLVPNQAKKLPMTYAMNNSFGFGGTNASVIFKKL